MDTLVELALRADPTFGLWFWLHAVGELLGLLSVPSVLLERRGKPMAALVWIMALLSMPYIGLGLWWLIGRRHLARRRARHRAASAAVSQRLASRALQRQEARLQPLLSGLPTAEEQGVFPPSDENFVDVLVDAAAVYPALERMIRGAEHHVHLLFYIWQPDATGTRFRDLLVERACAGVEVRLLYDAVGSPRLGRAFLAPLWAAGVRTAPFLPVRLGRRATINFRNHRKIVVVDGRHAYTGGLNVGDEYAGAWHDVGVHMSGPVVDQLQRVFADDWLFATGEDIALPAYFGRADGHRPELHDVPPGEDPSAVCSIVASGPDQRFNLTHDTFFMAITEARERIWLTTPYLIPGPTLLTALRCAVYRGVDVRLLVPEKSDLAIARLAARSYYPDLLSSGVRVFEYRPGVLHAKVLVFDRELSVLGSANLDTRSFQTNFEVSCFIASQATNRALAELFERDLEKSREVRREDLSPARTWDRLVESTAHLLSPLL